MNPHNENHNNYGIYKNCDQYGMTNTPVQVFNHISARPDFRIRTITPRIKVLKCYEKKLKQELNH